LEARLATLAAINNEGGAMQEQVNILNGHKRELEDHLALIQRLAGKMRDVGRETAVAA
jgi:hypothetical protein